MKQLLLVTDFPLISRWELERGALVPPYILILASNSQAVRRFHFVPLFLTVFDCFTSCFTFCDCFTHLFLQ